jgi:hypothetical protein
MPIVGAGKSNENLRFLYRLQRRESPTHFGTAVILKKRELAAMDCEQMSLIASSFSKNLSTAHF